MRVRISRKWTSVLGLLGLCLAGAGCGEESSTCQRACRKLANCQSPFGTAEADAKSQCNEIDTCETRASCEAKCSLNATCEEIQQGQTSSCLTRCRNLLSTEPVETPAADGGPARTDGYPQCTPSCYGKQCGDDGCGGSCGSCGSGRTCSYSTCVSSCTPSCYGKECGDDGCGGSCGYCSSSQTCSLGSCVSTSSSSVNSGKICYGQTDCATGDTCTLFSSSATKGMCLGACTTGGTACPVSGTQLSACAFVIGSEHRCAFICEFESQSYACPDSYSYDCLAIDSSQPAIKVCVPR